MSAAFEMGFEVRLGFVGADDNGGRWVLRRKQAGRGTVTVASTFGLNLRVKYRNGQ